MNSYVLRFAVKYFCVVLCGLYLFRIVLRRRPYRTFSNCVYSIGLTILSLALRTLGLGDMFLKVIPFPILAVASCEQPLLETVLASSISVGLSYFAWYAASFVAIPFAVILRAGISEYNPFVLLYAISIGSIQFLIVWLFSQLGRFRSGMPFLHEKRANILGAVISAMLLASIPVASFIADHLVPAFVVATAELGLVLMVWWHYELVIRFYQIMKRKQVDDLETENQHLRDLSEKQAKIIHTDVKIVSAMGSSLKGLIESADYRTSEDRRKAQELLAYLDTAAHKRDKLLFENQKADTLQETGVIAVDSMIDYLYGRASSEGITFTFAKFASVRHIVQTVISEDNLTVLLADLVTNAIIAERNADIKNLMLILRAKGDAYVIEVSDSGEPFSASVISKLGRGRITTHGDNGGSGYGLVTAFEILGQTNASFVLEETEGGPYTKKLSICFDGLSQIRIKSKRPEIMVIRSERKDIIWL